MYCVVQIKRGQHRRRDYRTPVEFFGKTADKLMLGRVPSVCRYCAMSAGVYLVSK